MQIQFVSPVRNEEKRLPKLIQSLLNQTNENWKLLIVDNASTDSTFSIGKYWESQDQRIKVFALGEEKENVFESWKAALKICFENTDCDYMQIAPGDDFLLSNDYVEIALQVLTESQVNGLVPSCQYRDRVVRLNDIKYKSLFKDWNYVHLVFGIYKTRNFRDSASKLFKIEDVDRTFDWWLSYFLIEQKPSYSPRIVFYRESNPRQKVVINPMVIRPILNHPILKPLKDIYAFRHPIRNYTKGIKRDFQQYILISGSLGTKNRLRLATAFLLRLLNIY